MADRITDKHLESMRARINTAACMPLKPWVFDAAFLAGLEFGR